jgi:hypothetical protein
MHVFRRVAQAKRKPCRDTPSQDLRGEWFSTGKLHRNIGEREKNEAQVLLGRLGTQEDAVLMPQTHVVELEGPTKPEGAILHSAQPHPLESLDNGVEVGGMGGADRNTNLLESPFRGDDESKLRKRTSAPGAHPAVWLAIRSLKRSTRCAKAPT